MIPLPWKILALVLVLAGAWCHGNRVGHRAESREWQVLQADLDRKAGETLLAEKDKVLAKERELSDFKSGVENESAERERKIAGLRIANGRLVSAAGGLWDKNGRARAQGSADGTGQGPSADGSGNAPSLGCALSQPVTDDLLDLARDADLDRNTALACQADLVGVTTILNELVKTD